MLAFLLAIVIALANYLGQEFSIEKLKYKDHIVSFVAGISVTYIFLHLLPNLYEGVTNFSRSLFVFVLLGFVLFHIVERFIYKFVGRGKISEDLKLNHSLWLLIYDISMGIVLIGFFKFSAINGFLFFVPVFLHSALSSLSVHKIHGFDFRVKPKIENKFTKFFLSAGSIYGAMIAMIFNIGTKLSFILTGLVAGILLYVVIRETIPKEKEGNPVWFVIGVVMYSLLIFSIWNI
jgi:hypothetical protein